MATKVNFIVSDITPIRQKVKLMEVGFMNAIEKAMTKATFIVENTAKQRVPVVSGRLRRSIRGGITDIGRGYVEGTVGAHTDYAAAVEFGRPKKDGGHTRATPYLSAAVSENKSKIQLLINQGLKNTLRSFKGGK